MAYRSGATYTGVDESTVGRKPGIAKQQISLGYGVYKTRQVKLTLEYCGFDQSNPVTERLRLSITLPEKWIEVETPVRELRLAFIKAYRKKFPNAPLATATDQEWSLAIKDESLLLFSKKPVEDDAIITQTFYEKQEVWAMGSWDWAAMETELKRLRKIITDDLAHTMRFVRHAPEQIVPVTSKKQLQPGQSYVVLSGWYKQQCCIVRPEMSIADIKAYLHHKNGPRMPMEALDVAMRRGDTLQVLDAALTLQQVYEMQLDPNADFTRGAAPSPEAEGEPPSSASAIGTAEADPGAGPSSTDKADIEIDTDAARGSPTEPIAPSFLGRAMALGVGKRIQDRKHMIWLPNVHDPHSFRTPNDQAPDGGTRYDALPAPRGWTAPAQTQPTVNDDESCSIM